MILMIGCVLKEEKTKCSLRLGVHYAGTDVNTISKIGFLYIWFADYHLIFFLYF